MFHSCLLKESLLQPQRRASLGREAITPTGSHTAPKPSASTKGFSRKRSNCTRDMSLPGRRRGRLNEGLLSEEKQSSVADFWTLFGLQPQRRASLGREAISSVPLAISRVAAASTKGFSRKRSNLTVLPSRSTNSAPQRRASLGREAIGPVPVDASVVVASTKGFSRKRSNHSRARGWR